MGKEIALFLLQLLALSIPPVTILIKLLRRSENLPWITRKAAFFSSIASITLFLTASALVLGYLFNSITLPLLLQVAFGVTIVGMVPFLFVTVALYRDHKANFG
ncbi:MAG: hypothetical protein ABEH90_08925 [Halolamina sp.]